MSGVTHDRQTLEEYLDAHLGRKHIVGEVMKERERQLSKWGVQHYGSRKWHGIAAEEFGEAIKDLNDADERFTKGKKHYDLGLHADAVALHEQAQRKMHNMRKEVIETIAVLFAWVEDMDGDPDLDPRP